MKGCYIEYSTARVIELEDAATCVYCGTTVAVGIGLHRERFALRAIVDDDTVYAHFRCCRRAGLFGESVGVNPTKSSLGPLSAMDVARNA